MAAAFHQSERGVAGIILTVVIGWALAAVLMLTSTLVSAQSIDRRVALITGEVGQIDLDTDTVKELEEVNATAADILVAAKPLSGQLTKVEASARSIDASVSGIQRSVVSINGTVNGIFGNVNSILSTARTIEAGVVAINTKADVAIREVRNILSLAKAVEGHANSIDCQQSALGSSTCRRL